IIHEDVAWDYLAWSKQLETLAGQARAVCFGTLGQRSPIACATIHRFLAATNRDCLVVFDVNLRQNWYRRESIADSLQLAQVVKLNHEEVVVLGKLFEIESDDDVVFAQALLNRFSLQAVCITRAEQGCRLVTADEHIEQPGIPVEVADAVGAGDAF